MQPFRASSISRLLLITAWFAFFLIPDAVALPTDSLWSSYKTSVTRRDTVQSIELLCALSRQKASTWIPADMRQAIRLLDRAMELAERRGDTACLVSVLIDYGLVWDYLNESGKAVKALSKALRYCIGLDRPDLNSLTLSHLSRAFFRIEDSAKTMASAFAQQAYALALRSGDARSLSTAAAELSRCYWSFKQYRESDVYAQRALIAAGADPHLFNRGRYLRARAVNAFGSQRYREAISLFRGAIAEFDRLGNPEIMRFLYIDIANAYSKLGETSYEDSNIVKAVDLFSSCADTSGLLSSLFYLASCREYQHRPHSADSLLRTAVSIATVRDDGGLSLAKAYRFKAQLALDRKRYQAAYGFLLTAASLVDTTSENHEKIQLCSEIFDRLYTLSLRLKRPSDALRWRLMLESVENQRQFRNDGVNLQFIHDLYVSKKEQETFDSLQSERRVRTLFTVGAGVIVCLLIIILANVSYTLRGRRDYERRINTYVDRLSSEQAELRRQNELNNDLLRQREEFIAIAAHDIKNPLIGIRMTSEQLRNNIGEPDTAGSTKVSSILHATERILSVVNRLISTASTAQKAADTTPGEKEIAAYTLMVVEDFEDRAHARDINIQFQSFLEHPRLIANTMDYHQIVENLLSNAVKYAPSSSTVQVILRENELRTELVVRDEGFITDADIIQTLFTLRRNPYVNVTDSHGVGLFAANETALRNGWRLSFSANPTTTFTLHLLNVT